MMHMTLFPDESCVSSIVIAHLPARPPARYLFAIPSPLRSYFVCSLFIHISLKQAHFAARCRPACFG